jgi:hypothetical protein
MSNGNSANRRATGGAAPPELLPGPDTVRDRLWLFACPTNTDFPHLGRRSVMSPVEGAFMMGIPNLIMVNSGGKEVEYGRYEPPFEQYTYALRPIKRVVWSVVGSGGSTDGTERELGIELAKKTPNFVGVFMDDFFRGDPREKPAILTLDELRDLRSRLKAGPKPLDLYITLYTAHLDFPLGDYLDLVDVVTLWTWKPADLVHLEENLAKAEALAPGVRKMLGCYWVDYTTKAGVPVASMELQCETGLRWLREGRIEGMVFLGNTAQDLGFETVEWTYEWIRRAGGERL